MFTLTIASWYDQFYAWLRRCSRDMDSSVIYYSSLLAEILSSGWSFQCEPFSRFRSIYSTRRRAKRTYRYPSRCPYASTIQKHRFSFNKSKYCMYLGYYLCAAFRDTKRSCVGHVDNLERNYYKATVCTVYKRSFRTWSYFVQGYNIYWGARNRI